MSTIFCPGFSENTKNVHFRENESQGTKANIQNIEKNLVCNTLISILANETRLQSQKGRFCNVHILQITKNLKFGQKNAFPYFYMTLMERYALNSKFRKDFIQFGPPAKPLFEKVWILRQSWTKGP